ncbi:hypothetical protein VaNZ11_014405 [Volvox africanus]|uniref:Membrane-associated protein n=1 Tax=Volvox africanus TaxID=51714 RepID=A0ABQ5SJ66_9CHLO|nr:hypothetical protein VaNZ11_014405 [Volvox africanus]
MPAGVEPSPDEVIVVLAQVAFIALALAAIVFATRAAQVSFDNRKVEVPVRLQAVGSSRQRLRTLSDRSQFHRAAAATSAVGTDGAGVGAAVPPSIWQRGDSHDLSLARDPSSPYQNAAPNSAEASGGSLNVLTAAAAALLHRRHVPTSPSISTDPSSCSPASGLLSTTSTAPLSTASTVSNSSGATTSTWAWQDQTPDRSRSLNGHRQHYQHHYQQHGRGSGALQHKCSDSLLETCRVFASVPHETITSTRQVLAAFNYDYSALHRRETSYVAGTSAWHARTGL